MVHYNTRGLPSFDNYPGRIDIALWTVIRPSLGAWKDPVTNSNRRIHHSIPAITKTQWYLRIMFALALALGTVRVTLMLWSEP